MLKTRTLFFGAVLFLLPQFAHAATVVSFTSVGTTTWTVPSGVTSVSYLVVGGGGGGGARGGGGGGAGGYQAGSSYSVTPGQSITVAVGSGGAGGVLSTQDGQSGVSSTFGSITSQGGGGGANFGSGVGRTGASGGGAWGAAGGSSIAGQGNNGGTGTSGSSYGASGGGGASAVGGSNSGTTPGNGGAGTANSITGSSVTYAGGGGGGGEVACSTGGAGGGGAGTCGSPGTTGGAGTANTGGGGGGGSAFDSASGGAGGSGIVVISYEPPRLTINDNVTINGDLNITGALAKSSGTFVIDHPLDPKNKLLFHSFVESPDAKTVYVGRATLDEVGSAAIALPAYFLALNKDFRYFATPVGVAMPDLHLSVEVKRRFFGLFGTPIFSIAGGVPGGEVSWMVTGIRHDPYILANPITPVVKKSAGAPYAQGMYVHPQLFAPSTPQK